jgi:teichuronic acid biosynthesis protein TuaE
MVLILFLCNIISIWEVVTGNHLVKDYLSTPLRQRLLQFVPGTFYRNPNDFATFVIQAIPFSLYHTMSRKKMIRMIAIFNIVASFFSVIAAQSRTQIILLILIYVCAAIFMDKRKLLGISVLLLLGVVIIYNVYPAFKELVDEGLVSISAGEIASSAEDGGSLGTRMALLKNAGYILLDTMGFGAGAGCHRVIMSEYAARYNNTGGTLVMHNLLGEIFVDYGIFIGIAFIITLVISIKKLFIIGRYAQEKKIRQFSFFLSVSLGVFVICGISSSSILQLTSLWMTICFASAFIKVYTNY